MAKAGRPREPAYLAYRFFWESLDWLYPPHGGCDTPGVRWCQKCQAASHLIKDPLCPVCGQPQKQDGTSPCTICKTTKPAYCALRSWAEFNGPIRQALHKLKYKKDIALGEALSRSLIPWFSGLGWIVDLVVPVPLSADRLHERGYNQTSYLAHPFAMCLGLVYRPNAIIRNRDTATQVGLYRSERRLNVSGAFAANKSIVQGKVVLVMDDVVTTGATLDACSQALLLAGASQVYGLTAARAVQF